MELLNVRGVEKIFRASFYSVTRRVGKVVLRNTESKSRTLLLPARVSGSQLPGHDVRSVAAMALMTEAFAVGAAPPTLPTARFAAQPRHQEAHEIREQGSSSALVAAATVLAAGVAAKRRTVPVRAAVVMRVR
ncbi:hypothetical protein AK812_SmicGene8670 [Symbiodinium microadriaticum]|uniref:Uncharacterized protein n=1 Tax=Symbiodinium microadriaticum TaxID=2951 RepID=A0A1Q9EKK2_SYMMI|nr:hypothetical protein AK812_SmicGene8670 [Symbiodinium microadriaticum]